MNFAVIGLGSFGIKRAQAIKSSKVAKLKVIFDLNDQNLTKARETLKVQSNNFEEILKDKTIDVVCICTPNKFHKDLIIKSLNAGKHVFCEKPLARNFKEAEEIFEVTKKTKNIFQII